MHGTDPAPGQGAVLQVLALLCLCSKTKIPLISTAPECAQIKGKCFWGAIFTGLIIIKRFFKGVKKQSEEIFSSRTRQGEGLAPPFLIPGHQHRYSLLSVMESVYLRNAFIPLDTQWLLSLPELPEESGNEEPWALGPPLCFLRDGKAVIFKCRIVFRLKAQLCWICFIMTSVKFLSSSRKDEPFPLHFQRRAVWRGSVLILLAASMQSKILIWHCSNKSFLHLCSAVNFKPVVLSLYFGSKALVFLIHLVALMADCTSYSREPISMVSGPERQGPVLNNSAQL